LAKFRVLKKVATALSCWTSKPSLPPRIREIKEYNPLSGLSLYISKELFKLSVKFETAISLKPKALAFLTICNSANPKYFLSSIDVRRAMVALVIFCLNKDIKYSNLPNLDQKLPRLPSVVVILGISERGVSIVSKTIWFNSLSITSFSLSIPRPEDIEDNSFSRITLCILSLSWSLFSTSIWAAWSSANLVFKSATISG